MVSLFLACETLREVVLQRSPLLVLVRTQAIPWGKIHRIILLGKIRNERRLVLVYANICEIR